MRARRSAFLATAALLAAGCSGGDGAAGDGAAAWRLDSTAVLEIGALEGDSAYQLFRVRGIAELPDGRIAVANGGTSEVRVYDARGTHERSIGRSGGGPGEFQMLMSLAARGDTLYAYDRSGGRLTRFLADGSYLGDVTLRTGAAGMTPNFSGVLADGSVVAWISSGPGERDGFVRDTAALVHFSADGTVLDTLGRFPGREMSLRTEQRSGNLTAVSLLTHDHYRTFLTAVAGDRVFAAPTDSAVVHAFPRDGSADTLRWTEPPRPVDDDYLAAVIADATAKVDSPAARQRVREAVLDAPRPPTRPVFDRMLASPAGELWLRRFGEPGQAEAEWLVLGADGTLHARLHVPAGRDIRALGRERVYTLERDEFDVEYVRAYPLRR